MGSSSRGGRSFSHGILFILICICLARAVQLKQYFYTGNNVFMLGYGTDSVLRAQFRARNMPDLSLTYRVTSIVALQDEEEAKIFEGIFPNDEFWLTKKKSGKKIIFSFFIVFF